MSATPRAEIEIKQMVQNTEFWLDFDTFSCIGDGHCLLYAITVSLKSQLNTDIALSDLKSLIIDECTGNDVYLDFMINNSAERFIIEMHSYIFEKKYNLSFVDLVPRICCNILNICIGIISRNSGQYMCELIYPNY